MALLLIKMIMNYSLTTNGADLSWYGEEHFDEPDMQNPLYSHITTTNWLECWSALIIQRKAVSGYENELSEMSWVVVTVLPLSREYEIPTDLT
jgi:hypothetical protein